MKVRRTGLKLLPLAAAAVAGNVAGAEAKLHGRRGDKGRAELLTQAQERSHAQGSAPEMGLPVEYAAVVPVQGQGQGYVYNGYGHADGAGPSNNYIYSANAPVVVTPYVPQTASGKQAQ